MICTRRYLGTLAKHARQGTGRRRDGGEDSRQPMMDDALLFRMINITINIPIHWVLDEG